MLFIKGKVRCAVFFSTTVLEFQYTYVEMKLCLIETPNAAGTDGAASGEAAFIWFLRAEGS